MNDTIILPDRVDTRKEATAEQKIKSLHEFYKPEIEKGLLKSIKLDRLKIVEKLVAMGFCRYDTADGVSQYVKIVDNKIEITNEQFIIDAFEDYVKNLPDNIMKVYDQKTDDNIEVTITGRYIQSIMYQNLQSYFSTTLGRLRPDKKIELVTDKENCKYLFFNNTIALVTDDNINLIPYNELEGYIWNSTVLDRNFLYTTRIGDFETFIINITGKDAKRKQSLMSLIGYLMHDFYECDLKAVFLTDVNIDTMGEAAGRTGKGLIGKALSCMLNKNTSDSSYVAIPGKDIDFKSDTRYALANLNTQLLHLEDLYKGFALESLYTDITDGTKIRKPYQIKPIIRLLKIMISVNYTLDLKGSSDKGRLSIFELANYYSNEFTPEKEFGKRFFESKWTVEDWHCFDSFMCRSVQTYLQSGIITAEEINYSMRTLAEHTSEDFVYWITDYINAALTSRTRTECNKTSMFSDFRLRYKDYDTLKFKQSRFSKWCQSFFKLKNIPFCEIRATSDIFIIYPDKADFAISKNQKSKISERQTSLEME